MVIKYKSIINKYRQFGHRISQKVMNRVSMDYKLKMETVRAAAFVKQYLEKLKTAVVIKGRIVKRNLNKKLYWKEIENTSYCFLSYLTAKYHGGSPPSLLAAFAIYLSDRILNDYYSLGSTEKRTVLNKKLVDRYTGVRINRCSSQIITKLNRFLEENIDLIKEDIGSVDLRKKKKKSAGSGN